MHSSSSQREFKTEHGPCVVQHMSISSILQQFPTAAAAEGTALDPADPDPAAAAAAAAASIRNKGCMHNSRLVIQAKLQRKLQQL
eukprot:scaffold138591_cov20-Tisochrysis_lutea.AAC.1